MNSADTIAAIATPPGYGGVGIVRVSGPQAAVICEEICGILPRPRMAVYRPFLDETQQRIDEGIVVFFSAPHSFTGENVLELQGHGGPVVMDLLLQRVLRLGARSARPGEFSERAFLNGKLDLTQAEAIADLIEARTETAARLASRTLQGEFSKRVHGLTEQLISLRLYLEAALDFPEEEIDFLSDARIGDDLEAIIAELLEIQQRARTGRLMRDGMTLVIAGRPNAGKSSLLNALSGEETAIVTEIPGTTRDLLRERIQIDGMPIHVIDTAGLRESADPIEQEGIRRARTEIGQADRILWVFDDRADPQHLDLDRKKLPAGVPLTLIRNKIDLTAKLPMLVETPSGVEISLAARSGLGIELLKTHLKQSVGYDSGDMEGEFIARRRHLDALARTLDHLQQGRCLLRDQQAAELLAEELRLCQQILGEITGEFAADDLLGRIFSSFCIGK